MRVAGINTGSNINFGAKYDITVVGKNNPQQKFLYNTMKDFVDKHNVPATFHMGEDKIVLQPANKTISQKLEEGLKKLGIIREIEK